MTFYPTVHLNMFLYSDYSTRISIIWICSCIMIMVLEFWFNWRVREAEVEADLSVKPLVVEFLWIERGPLTISWGRSGPPRPIFAFNRPSLHQYGTLFPSVLSFTFTVCTTSRPNLFDQCTSSVVAPGVSAKIASFYLHNLFKWDMSVSGFLVDEFTPQIVSLSVSLVGAQLIFPIRKVSTTIITLRSICMYGAIKILFLNVHILNLHSCLCVFTFHPHKKCMHYLYVVICLS